jgi:DNA-binding HxlR family transcriptional regulator
VGTSYGQFCPVAKAMELLDERWTMLLVRELVMGSEHFNDLRRGLPRMSPSLLSKRLQQLVRAGIVEKSVDGGDVCYRLTPAGEELRPVVEAVGAWGARWIGEIGDRQLDPKLLLWDMHRNVVPTAVPPGRTVLHFRFPEIAGSDGRWWLVISPAEVDVCTDDPGHEVDLTLTSSLRVLTEVWTGDLSWPQSIGSGALEVTGPSRLRRELPAWFSLSSFAAVPRGHGLVRV